MSKPYVHAVSSAKRFGGKPEDYVEIHNLMDSSKGAMCDNRHRALTHNSWFLSNILERVKFHNSIETSPGNFTIIVNSDGRKISVRDIGEQHVAEDFRGQFIPSAQDYLQEMEIKDWMNNGRGVPASFKKIDDKLKSKLPSEVEKTTRQIRYD